MENMRPLSMSEMEQVSGGGAMTVRTGEKGDIIRSGPGKNFHQVATLTNYAVVNSTGSVSYNDQENEDYCQINSPVYGWMLRKDLGE